MKRDAASDDVMNNEDLVAFVQTTIICDSIISSTIFFINQSVINLYPESGMHEKDTKRKKIHK